MFSRLKHIDLAPPEIWSSIFWNVPRHDLPAVLLTCSHFASIAWPILYSSVSLSDTSPFLQTTFSLISSSTNIATSIQRIKFVTTQDEDYIAESDEEYMSGGDEKYIPDNDEEYIPGNDEEHVPGSEEGNDGEYTPGNDEGYTLGNDEEYTPGNGGEDLPSNDEGYIPGDDEEYTSRNGEEYTPRNSDTWIENSIFASMTNLTTIELVGCPFQTVESQTDFEQALRYGCPQLRGFYCFFRNDEIEWPAFPGTSLPLIGLQRLLWNFTLIPHNPLLSIVTASLTTLTHLAIDTRWNFQNYRQAKTSFYSLRFPNLVSFAISAVGLIGLGQEASVAPPLELTRFIVAHPNLRSLTLTPSFQRGGFGFPAYLCYDMAPPTTLENLEQLDCDVVTLGRSLSAGLKLPALRRLSLALILIQDPTADEDDDEREDTLSSLPSTDLVYPHITELAFNTTPFPGVGLNKLAAILPGIKTLTIGGDKPDSLLLFPDIFSKLKTINFSRTMFYHDHSPSAFADHAVAMFENCPGLEDVKMVKERRWRGQVLPDEEVEIVWESISRPPGITSTPV